MMTVINIEKVEFDESKIGEKSSVDIQFIVNGHSGTAKVEIDKNLNLKAIYDFKIEKDNNNELKNAGAMYFLARALQSRFQTLAKNK